MLLELIKSDILVNEAPLIMRCDMFFQSIIIDLYTHATAHVEAEIDASCNPS